jgi:5-deoxy-glucuronate isomerase
MSLLVHPDPTGSSIETFGFELLGFRNKCLQTGEQFTEDTGAREVAVVLLGGTCSVRSTAGDFPAVGGRKAGFLIRCTCRLGRSTP